MSGKFERMNGFQSLQFAEFDFDEWFLIWKSEFPSSTKIKISGDPKTKLFLPNRH